MKKAILLLTLLLLNSSLILAQDETKKDSHWKLSGNNSLNFVQATYNNWAAGGENSIAGAASSSLFLKYNKNKASFEANLLLAYGQTFQGSKRSKNEDKIDFSSKYGYLAIKNWNYTALISVRTQFDKGYAKYPIEEGAVYNSKFMAPGFIVLSLGMDYKPSSNFSLLLSPISGKLTIVLDDSLSNIRAFGVPKGEKVNKEFGAFIKTVFTAKLKDNISLRSTFDIFSNLLEQPENMDINWELSLDMRISKLISSKITFNYMYDDNFRIGDKGPRGQFKQVMGLGFSYMF